MACQDRCSSRSMIRIGISGRPAVGLIAVVLVLAACGNRDEASAEPFAEPSAGSSQRASSLPSAPPHAAGMCPEIAATSLPADLRTGGSSPRRVGPRSSRRPRAVPGSGWSGAHPSLRNCRRDPARIDRRTADDQEPPRFAIVALGRRVRRTLARSGRGCTLQSIRGRGSKLSRSEMEAVLAGIR